MRVGPPANMDMASVAMKHGSPSFEQRRCPTVPPVKHVQVWFILRSFVRDEGVQCNETVTRTCPRETESRDQRASRAEQAGPWTEAWCKAGVSADLQMPSAPI